MGHQHLSLQMAIALHLPNRGFMLLRACCTGTDQLPEYSTERQVFSHLNLLLEGTVTRVSFQWRHQYSIRFLEPWWSGSKEPIQQDTIPEQRTCAGHHLHCCRSFSPSLKTQGLPWPLGPCPVWPRGGTVRSPDEWGPAPHC